MDKNRVWQIVGNVLGAYVVVLNGILAGVTLRISGDLLFERLPEYHCNDWDSHVGWAVFCYAALVPLVMIFLKPNTRIAAFATIGIAGAILASFMLSYTKIIPCSPL